MGGSGILICWILATSYMTDGSISTMKDWGGTNPESLYYESQTHCEKDAKTAQEREEMFREAMTSNGFIKTIYKCECKITEIESGDVESED